MTNVHFLYHSMAGDFRQSKTAKVPRTSLRFGAPHFLRRIHQLLSTKDAASSGDILYRFDNSRTATSLLKLSSLSMAMILSLPSLMAIFRPSLRASVSISSIALHILLIHCQSPILIYKGHSIILRQGISLCQLLYGYILAEIKISYSSDDVEHPLISSLVASFINTLVVSLTKETLI